MSIPWCRLGDADLVVPSLTNGRRGLSLRWYYVLQLVCCCTPAEIACESNVQMWETHMGIAQCEQHRHLCLADAYDS